MELFPGIKLKCKCFLLAHFKFERVPRKRSVSSRNLKQMELCSKTVLEVYTVEM